MGYRVRRAHYDDLDEIYDLLVPFFEAKKLLDRRDPRFFY